MARNRRDFLKSLGCIGGALLCRPKGIAASEVGSGTVPGLTDFQYRTVAIEHLAEMKQALEKLNGERKVSQQKTIQGYLKDLKYHAEKLKGLGDWFAKDMKYLSRNVRLALPNSAGWVALR